MVSTVDFDIHKLSKTNTSYVSCRVKKKKVRKKIKICMSNRLASKNSTFFILKNPIYIKHKFKSKKKNYSQFKGKKK